MKRKLPNTLGTFDGRKVFFTSDTHFCDDNIIAYTNRPFRTTDEMDEALIENWNAVVPKDGIVFHLGDLCFGRAGKYNKILKRLNGTIYLVLGNHDIRNLPEKVEWRFKGIYSQMYITVDGQNIWLNHYPFLCFGGAYNGVWQLFGHVHSGERSVTGIDLPRLDYLFPTQYDVGVDNNNYRPVSFTDVKQICTRP